MNKYLFTVLSFLLLFNYSGICQVDYFMQGNNYFQNGDYKTADSLFTLDIRKKSNPDSYYNRGISRLYMKDTLGFCNDMENAGKVFSDTEAVHMYDKLCCNYVDTVFFDKKYLETIKGQHRFFDVIKSIKYSQKIRGESHNIHEIYTKLTSDFSSDGFHLNEFKTGIFATFEIIDDEKIYIHTIDPPKLLNYEEIRTKSESVTQYLKTKYKWFLDKNNLTQLSVYYRYIIKPTGEISDITCISVRTDLEFSEIKDDLQKDAESIILKQKYKPGLVREKKVSVYGNYTLSIK